MVLEVLVVSAICGGRIHALDSPNPRYTITPEGTAPCLPVGLCVGIDGGGTERHKAHLGSVARPAPFIYFL